MKKIRYLLFVSLLGFYLTACGDDLNKSNLPLTIESVQTHRVDRQLVRVIQYNRIELPLLEIELIKAPGRKLIIKKEINSISVKFDERNHLLNFEDRAAVDFEKIRVEGAVVKLNVGYTAAEHTSPYIVAECVITIDAGLIGEPECRVISWGNEDMAKPEN